MKPLRPLPRMFRMRVFVRHQVLRQQLVQPRPDRVRPVLRLLDQLRRDHHVRVHRPERNPDPLRQVFAPLLRLPHRVLVADHKRRIHILEQPLMRLMRSAPHHKADVALRQVLFDVRKPLLQKHVVPQVGMREVRDPREVHNQRQLQQVGHFHRDVHRMVVDSALRPACIQ